MSPWFRWHEGTTEDGKFRVVARNAGVTVRDVIALWAFMLEDAASHKHRGVCTRKEDFMSAILDFEEGAVDQILEQMEAVEMVSVGHGAITIQNWGKRQYETDIKDGTNADRQRKFRERKRNDDKPTTKQQRNGSVTATKLPEAEAEADTESKKEDAEADASGANAPRDIRTELFGPGLEALARITGKSPNSCRSLLGRWLKDVDDEAIHILGAIEEAERNRVADPVAWIYRVLKPHQRTVGNGSSGKITPLAAIDQHIERLRGASSGTSEGIVRLLSDGRRE